MELLPATRAASADPKAEDGEGIELTLGLAIGGSTRKTPEPRKEAEGPRKGGIFDLPDGASAEDRAAMDAQMLRSRARDRAVREEEALSGDRSRPSRTDGGNGVRWPRVAPVSTPNPNAHPNPFGFGHHHPFPVMYPHQQVQYVPVPNGFGFPFVMPCWAPTISAVAGGLNRLERKVYQPLSGRGFPVQGTAAGPCDGDSSGSKGIEAAKDVNTSLNSDSSGSSSSAISDRRSGSFGGGSISSGDSRSHRSLQKAEKPAAPPSAEGGSGNNALTSCLTSNAKPARFGAQLERAGSVNKSGKPSALPRMPLVSATGDAPHGRTIHGLLYRCTKSEVRILCVCHGNSFTPVEFVRHAGGADVSQPLKRIVVVQPGW
ncbi:ninja-family protein Os07g0602900 [Musa acuminata AAA Group]|uniref:ninja-family protein Os07g0602900 n=1 Tax=Musa acuminata AAA Group TaxID=214697 RepID=UPI0031D96208